MSTQYDTWTGEITHTETPATEKQLIKKLPNLLRFLGAGALIIAMYSFLANGWDSGNDIYRYLLMLGHTAVLAIIGMASGHWLKESKGARLLITLALVSVPANFAILGAFIYSQVPAVNASHYPHYVAWSVDSMNTALFTSAGAMLVLLPITLLGFTVLARSMSRRLSLLFLASNALLLLPVRDPQVIGLLVIGSLICTLFLSKKTADNQTSAKTREGITALGLQLLPVAVLMGRSLWLYSSGLFLLTVLAITCFFAIRQVSVFLEPGSKLRGGLDFLSLLPAMAAAPLLTGSLHGIMSLPYELAFPISIMLTATMVYDISLRSKNNAVTYRRIAVRGLMLGLIANLVVFNGPMAAAACLITGLGLILFGLNKQRRTEFVSGVILVVSGMVQQFYGIMHHFDLGSWATLAVLGIISIVVASTIESQGVKLKSRLVSLKSRFDGWEN